jgi:hypothetical protein
MNERIKELAEQAGIAVWGDAVYMYDPKDTLDSTVLEKFAELIVRECVAKIRKGTENTVQYDLAYNAMLTAIIADIHESFGVE